MQHLKFLLLEGFCASVKHDYIVCHWSLRNTAETGRCLNICFYVVEVNGTFSALKNVPLYCINGFFGILHLPLNQLNS